jgi:hypothetical protein
MKLIIFAPVIFLELLGESPANNLSSSTNQVTEYQQCRNSAETELNQRSAPLTNYKQLLWIIN